MSSTNHSRWPSFYLQKLFSGKKKAILKQRVREREGEDGRRRNSNRRSRSDTQINNTENVKGMTIRNVRGCKRDRRENVFAQNKFMRNDDDSPD